MEDRSWQMDINITDEKGRKILNKLQNWKISWTVGARSVPLEKKYIANGSKKSINDKWNLKLVNNKFNHKQIILSKTYF